MPKAPSENKDKRKRVRTKYGMFVTPVEPVITDWNKLNSHDVCLFLYYPIENGNFKVIMKSNDSLSQVRWKDLMKYFGGSELEYCAYTKHSNPLVQGVHGDVLQKVSYFTPGTTSYVQSLPEQPTETTSQQPTTWSDAKEFLIKCSSAKEDLCKAALDILGEDKYKDIEQVLTYPMLEYHRLLMQLDIPTLVTPPKVWVAVDPVTVLIPVFLLATSDKNVWDDIKKFIQNASAWECNRIAAIHNTYITDSDLMLKMYPVEMREDDLLYKINKLEQKVRLFMQNNKSFLLSIYVSTVTRVKEGLQKDSLTTSWTKCLPPTPSMQESKYSLSRVIKGVSHCHP